VNKPGYFEMLDTHAVFRPVGEVSLEQLVLLVASAITYAREQQVRKLLVVTTGLTGFQSPTVSERYHIVHRWGWAAGSTVRVSFVVIEEVIDPLKFGVLVAVNIGFATDIFSSEKEALAWLLSED
jgi:hypothetical protein